MEIFIDRIELEWIKLLIFCLVTVELTHQLSLTRPKVIVTIPECFGTIQKAVKNANLDLKVVIKDRVDTPVPDGTIRFSEVAENGEADLPLLDRLEKRKPNDVTLIPFSSGTTGLPKGVEITNRNILAAMQLMSEEKNCYPKLANGK